VTDYSTLTTCRDITDDMINDAVESREDMRALFERAVAVAQPRHAGSRLLLLFAKMATPACDWLEGALRVDLRAEGETTVIESVVDIGAGLKERVFPTRTVHVPLVEFEAAIKKFPQAIAPLSAQVDRYKIVLTAAEAPKVLDDEQDDKPVVKKPLTTMGAADLPTVSSTKPALQPVISRPLAKLQLRKTAVAGGITEINSPKKKKAKSSKPPPPKKPSSKPPKAAEKKEDVDKGWDE
jgi:hypothetical protein